MRFEHEITTKPDLAKLMEAIDAKGAAGWELVTVIFNNAGSGAYSAFFKRTWKPPPSAATAVKK